MVWYTNSTKGQLIPTTDDLLSNFMSKLFFAVKMQPFPELQIAVKFKKTIQAYLESQHLFLMLLVDLGVTYHLMKAYVLEKHYFSRLPKH